MKYYRLSENHPHYGIAGNVIPFDVWQKVAYTDKPLYDQIDEHGRGFPYKVEVGVIASTPVLFYMHSYADVVILMQRIGDRAGVRHEKVPIILPRSDAKVFFAGYEITVKYREEWEEQE